MSGDPTEAPPDLPSTGGRTLTVGAAQLGPVELDHSRADVVERLVALLRTGAARGCRLVVFPELALTTFFPRWWFEDQADVDAFFETELPGPQTKPLFDEAARLGVGFALGYAELTPQGEHFNTSALVGPDGTIVGTYRKVHLPGHESYEPWRPFQHLERGYFKAGSSFDVWRAFGGVIGMMICNDRRWPESYRVLALQGAELCLVGYNTPLVYPPDPSQNILQGFHNSLVLQAGAYQNGMWVVGVAKGGSEGGVDSLAQSCIVAPSGQIVAQAWTDGDELVVADCDLDRCRQYRETLFDFARYRRPEVYGLIVERKGAVQP